MIYESNNAGISEFFLLIYLLEPFNTIVSHYAILLQTAI